MATVTRLTIEDFEKLPDALAENHELVNGELVDVSGNTGGHNRLRDVLMRWLGSYVDEHKLGLVVAEQEFQFDEDAYGPEISVLGPGAAAQFDHRLRVQRFVPDLAIEVASQGERFEALLGKVMRYRHWGTKEVFIFSMATRQVFVSSDQPPVILTESEEFRPEQIRGFSIRIRDLFAKAGL